MCGFELRQQTAVIGNGMAKRGIYLGGGDDNSYPTGTYNDGSFLWRSEGIRAKFVYARKEVAQKNGKLFLSAWL